MTLLNIAHQLNWKITDWLIAWQYYIHILQILTKYRLCNIIPITISTSMWNAWIYE